MVADPEITESVGGSYASPCWRCGSIISPKNVGYNIHAPNAFKDPVYHPSVLNDETAAPCDSYRWLCWRCAKVEGYLW